MNDKLLDAEWDGLGNGETPIFPISVMQLKAGVNYNPGDPGYDIFKKACKVSAKRLFPNFVNVDASYNIGYYDGKDYNTAAAAMGCRTKVMSNVNGPQQTGGRGNFAFTTLNLPKFALEAIECVKKELNTDDIEKIRPLAIKKFYEIMDQYTAVSRHYLEKRYDVIAHKHVKNFPFLMGEGIYMGSEGLGAEDEIAPALKNCSISIGFCGLAECLKALTGKHHGESEESQKLGLEIIGHLRHSTDLLTEETHMNWSCFATPAESTAGQFQRSNKKIYGEINGVTDREYMTNSSHKSLNVA